jgi:TRAP-type transport system periplasmic protein
LKKVLVSGLLLLLMLVFIFPACGSPSSSQPAQVIKLKYSTSMNATEPPIVIASYYLDQLEKKSNGRIKVEKFVGGTLGKQNEQLGLVSGGSVDFCSISASWIRDKLPLHSYMNWALGGPDVVANIQRKMNFEIAETVAILDKENTDNGIKILTFFNTGQNGIISKVPFTKLADLKGKKIGTAPNYRALDAMGLTTVSMQIPDIYEGLSKGVIDAQALSIAPMAAMKWHEVSKCFMGDRHYAAGQFICINLKTYNGLPADIQKIITETAVDAQKWGAEYDKKNGEDTQEIFKKAGLTVGTLPESDTQQMFTLEYGFRAKDMLDLCTPQGKTEQANIILKNLDKITGVTR